MGEWVENWDIEAEWLEAGMTDEEKEQAEAKKKLYESSKKLNELVKTGTWEQVEQHLDKEKQKKDVTKTAKLFGESIIASLQKEIGEYPQGDTKTMEQWLNKEEPIPFTTNLGPPIGKEKTNFALPYGASAVFDEMVAHHKKMGYPVGMGKTNMFLNELAKQKILAIDYAQAEVKIMAAIQADLESNSLEKYQKRLLDSLNFESLKKEGKGVPLCEICRKSRPQVLLEGIQVCPACYMSLTESE
jgi:hypothetical protein